MSRNLELCHPKLGEMAAELVKRGREQGLIIKIGECFRSAAEQDKLYAQGRTAAGSIVTYARGSSYSSMHQWGVAFDVIRNDGKGAYNNSDGWFDKVGKLGKQLGLEWGGDWTSPVDKPHFQLKEWGSTPTKLKKLYGTPDRFKMTWRSKNMIDNYDEAVKVLVKSGVITSADYWDNAVKCVKYLDRLIINMANKLID